MIVASILEKTSETNAAQQQKRRKQKEAETKTKMRKID